MNASEFVKKLVSNNFDISKMEMDLFEIVEFIYSNPEISEYMDQRSPVFTMVSSFNLLNKVLVGSKDDFNSSKFILEKLFKPIPKGKEDVFTVTIPNVETGEPEEMEFA